MFHLYIEFLAFVGSTLPRNQVYPQFGGQTCDKGKQGYLIDQKLKTNYFDKV